MNRWLRRVKAAITLGGFWGAASGLVAAACQGVLQLLGGGLAWDLILRGALQYGLTAWLVGSAFAGTLIEFEARGILGRMKSWRVGLWGALMGGVLAPLVVVMTSGSVLPGPTLAALAGLGCVVGSALSVGTLRLAASVSKELAAGASREELGAAERDELASRET